MNVTKKKNIWAAIIGEYAQRERKLWRQGLSTAGLLEEVMGSLSAKERKTIAPTKRQHAEKIKLNVQFFTDLKAKATTTVKQKRNIEKMLTSLNVQLARVGC